MPELGRNSAKQSHVAAYNLLFHSALPQYSGGAGTQVSEDAAPVPCRRPSPPPHPPVRAALCGGGVQ